MAAERVETQLAAKLAVKLAAERVSQLPLRSLLRPSLASYFFMIIIPYRAVNI